MDRALDRRAGGQAIIEQNEGLGRFVGGWPEGAARGENISDWREDWGGGVDFFKNSFGFLK